MPERKPYLVFHPQLRVPEEVKTAALAWNRAVYLAKVFKEIIKIEAPDGTITKANPTSVMSK